MGTPSSHLQNLPSLVSLTSANQGHIWLILFHSVGQFHVLDNINSKPHPPASEVLPGLAAWSRFQKRGFRGKEVLGQTGRCSIPIYFGRNGILEFLMTIGN